MMSRAPRMARQPHPSDCARDEDERRSGSHARTISSAAVPLNPGIEKSAMATSQARRSSADFRPSAESTRSEKTLKPPLLSARTTSAASSSESSTRRTRSRLLTILVTLPRSVTPTQQSRTPTIPRRRSSARGLWAPRDPAPGSSPERCNNYDKQKLEREGYTSAIQAHPPARPGASRY